MVSCSLLKLNEIMRLTSLQVILGLARRSLGGLDSDIGCIALLGLLPRLPPIRFAAEYDGPRDFGRFHILDIATRRARARPDEVLDRNLALLDGGIFSTRGSSLCLLNLH